MLDLRLDRIELLPAPALPDRTPRSCGARPATAPDRDAAYRSSNVVGAVRPTTGPLKQTAAYVPAVSFDSTQASCPPGAAANAATAIHAGGPSPGLSRAERLLQVRDRLPLEEPDEDTTQLRLGPVPNAYPAAAGLRDGCRDGAGARPSVDRDGGARQCDARVRVSGDAAQQEELEARPARGGGDERRCPIGGAP